MHTKVATQYLFVTRLDLLMKTVKQPMMIRMIEGIIISTNMTDLYGISESKLSNSNNITRERDAMFQVD